MYKHHIDSIENLKKYYSSFEGLIAIILDGSIVKGKERPDSDIDAVIVVTDERYEELKSQGKTAEVIHGYCTYEGGYFDVKYKTKSYLCRAAKEASEPTRNAFSKAKVIYSTDNEIDELVNKIQSYPEWLIEEKIKCFCANIQLNKEYFLRCVKEDNSYMLSHVSQEIVYSVYRLILIENRVLFACNRRLEESVSGCEKKPENIIELGKKLLKDVTYENACAFYETFKAQTSLQLIEDISTSCANYVAYYEDWWLEKSPFPNEW